MFVTWRYRYAYYSLIACTDISICLNAADNPKRFFFLDSNAILAETTYNKYLEIQ